MSTTLRREYSIVVNLLRHDSLHLNGFLKCHRHKVFFFLRTIMASKAFFKADSNTPSWWLSFSLVVINVVLQIYVELKLQGKNVCRFNVVIDYNVILMKIRSKLVVYVLSSMRLANSFGAR